MNQRGNCTTILTAAAWFGIASGFLEGMSMLGLQAVGRSTWTMGLKSVGPPILWISPLFNMALFVVSGALVCLAARLRRSSDGWLWSVGLFAGLTAYDVMATLDRIPDWSSAILGVGLGVQAARWAKPHTQRIRTFQRRTLPVLATLVMVAFLGATYGIRAMENSRVSKLPSAPPGAPNIMLVVWDTVRADHTTLHGYQRQTSPNLERLAAQGVVFTRAYAASSWTRASMATMITGRYPHELQADHGPLRDEFTTIAEVLSGRGYATAGFVGNTVVISKAAGMAQGSIHHEDTFNNVPDSLIRTLFGRKIWKYILPEEGPDALDFHKFADEITDDTLRWLDRRPADRPFFALLNYYDAHDPSFPPPPFDGMFAPAEKVQNRNWLDTHKPVALKATPEQVELDMAAYDGAVAFIDQQMARLWQEMERRGLTENTILIVTADHGHSFGEAGVWGHRTSLRIEQIHVPLVIYGRKRIPGGVRLGTPISQRQIASTIADLAGIADQPFPGSSLRRLWAGSGNGGALEPVVAELARPLSRDLPAQWPVTRGDLSSILTERWQYVECADGHTELYDLNNDSPAVHNLADTPAYDPLLASFHQQLAAAAAATRAPARSANDREVRELPRK